jgi:hypothetical protein
MMNRHNPVAQHPVSAPGSFGIPLLDDAFDPDEEEVVEHSDVYSSYIRHHSTDDSLL